MAKSKSLHAMDYLADPKRHEARPFCVAHGDDSFLKEQVRKSMRAVLLPDEEADFSYTEFEGRSATLKDVIEELSTMAMFGGGRRFIVVEDADDFVTRFRTELENYAAKPRSKAVLFLEVKTWPSNTRLAKSIAQTGFPIDCSAPKSAKLDFWVESWGKERHGVKLTSAAASFLVESVGDELGLLDRELSKLALIAEPDKPIGPDVVRKNVGSWRTKSTWAMLDLALAGQTREALIQLDKLLTAGEAPIALLAQVSFSLRRLAAATRLVMQDEAAGRPIRLANSLERAGVKGFVIKKSADQLKRLGRHRGQLLLDWLIQADLDMKGDSRVAPRHVLERLLVQLSSASLRGKDAAAGLRPRKPITP
jgi:DNA polymerase III subunit delta